MLLEILSIWADKARPSFFKSKILQCTCHPLGLLQVRTITRKTITEQKKLLSFSVVVSEEAQVGEMLYSEEF